MYRRKKGVTFGSVLMIVITVAVAVGSVGLLGRIGGRELGHFDAGELISAMHHSLVATDEPMGTPAPQSTIKTTTVTLAPAQSVVTAAPTEAPVSHTVTLTLGGQLAFQSDVADCVMNADNGDFTKVIAGISDQVYANLNVCTLPHLLDTQAGQYADISTVEDVLQAVKVLGMDQVLLNHGHLLDKGDAALDSTLTTLMNAEVGYAGIHDLDENGGTKLYTVNGVDIALLGYIDTASGKTQDALQSSNKLMKYTDQQAAADIAAARRQGADIVLVSVWWSKADAAQITDHQRDIARNLCLYGADVILGGGSDALLPVEWVDAVDASGRVHRSLCAYSMGTLLGEKRDQRSQVCSALLHLRITVNGADGSVRFDNVSYTPTYIWKQEVDGKVIFRVIPAAKEPDAAMSQRQREIMGRALTLVDEVMAGGPAVRRDQ